LPGGYRVLDIRQGGMGVVYICHQSDTDELYAIKTVRLDGRAKEVDARLKLFSKEVRTWIHISNNTTNPHLVRALTFNSDHRMLYLEFINGLPLNRVVEKGRTVHVDHTLQWAKDIACGMEELHSRYRIVHRDLKPQNVLIHGETERLTAKITDFGITRNLSERGVAPARIGTPAYMAPEVDEGFGADFRSDIYSYGATLAWMVTGNTVFDVARTRALPEALVGLIQKCLEREPSARIQTFGEIRAILDGIKPDSSLSTTSYYHYCKLHQYQSPVERQALSKTRRSPCLFCIQAADLLRRESTMLLGVKEPADTVIAQPEVTEDTLLKPGATEVTVSMADELDSTPAAPGRRWLWLVAAGVVMVAVVAMLPDRVWRAYTDTTPPGPALLPRSAPTCTMAECDSEALPKPEQSSFRGDPRYCADHALFECPLCRRTFHSSDMDFEGKCDCGGAITAHSRR